MPDPNREPTVTRDISVIWADTYMQAYITYQASATLCLDSKFSVLHLDCVYVVCGVTACVSTDIKIPA